MLFSLLFALISSVHSANEICPGSSFSCPDTATCCQLADKSYGCCPLKNAVCCDDHIHCCPQNTRCEVGMCIKLEGVNITAKKLSSKDKYIYPLKTKTSKDKDIDCFGTEFLCPDNTTCCKGSKPESYDCCPLEHAVCCSDGYHCCPENTICDLKTLKCVGKQYITQMYDFMKIHSPKHNFVKYLPLTTSENVTNVICPGSSFQCPNGYTCCLLPSGSWGCCPFVKATCCQDRLHCCPENMKCGSTSKTCSQGLRSVPSSLKELSKPISSVITCPDNSTCAESMTCCELNNRHFGCCPYPDAVCCEDHSHCCPYSYICNVAEKQCIPKQKWLYNAVSKYYKKLG